MSRPPLQRVLALDLQQAVDEDAIAERLPRERWSVEFLRLSDVVPADVMEFARERSEIDFPAASLGVDELVRAARKADADTTPVHCFVHGHAPLPLFAQLGHQLSAWASPVTLLNQRKGGEWDELTLDAQDVVEGAPPFFDVVEGLAVPSEASGRVAVFVSVMGNGANKEALRDFVDSEGQTLAGIVEIRTGSSSILDASNVSVAARELAEQMSQLSVFYPHALVHGVTLFVAGPAPLAFLAGRGINRNIVATLSVPNFAGGPYSEAVQLPLDSGTARSLDTSEEAVSRREATRGFIRETFDALREQVLPDHVPAALLSKGLASQLVQGLRDLRFSDEAPCDGFELRILERRLAIGESLVDALSGLAPETVQSITRQFVLHELFHDFQALTHGNYRQIGRAGVVLEDIDFWADVFAVQTLAALHEADGEDETDAVVQEIDAVLAGIKAFDQSEQGQFLERLYERRLRRYLIWHLQRARAATLQDNSDVAQLFSNRLIVELVPTTGRLDTRGDKLVHRAGDRTQLVVLCDGRLERFPADDNISPALMIEHVRTFNDSSLREQMERVVGTRADLLAPWATLERRER